LGADEATALINKDEQRTGLQPPKYAFTPKKVVTLVYPAASRSTYRLEQQVSSELERHTNSTRKDKQNAIHGHCQNHERLRRRRLPPDEFGDHEKVT
jgi:hypothetical protein